MRAFWIAPILLAGCASMSTPEYVARQSNWDVCRFTMGGPHARNAEVEAQRRGLDCRPYYGAIQQKNANDAAAIRSFQRAIAPPAPVFVPSPSVNCTSHRAGNTVQTNCY
jgi:hypothetical protein